MARVPVLILHRNLRTVADRFLGHGNLMCHPQGRWEGGLGERGDSAELWQYGDSVSPCLLSRGALREPEPWGSFKICICRASHCKGFELLANTKALHEVRDKVVRKSL